MATSNDYDASEIQVLEGLEAVRKRPGMYIGSTSEKGLHHLVYEVVDNAIDEAVAGFGDTIDVTIHKDESGNNNSSVSVRDHGRGIPVDIHKKTGKPALEVVLTVLHAGGKFGNGAYKVSGGLHGVGVSVVNALSTEMVARVFRDGNIYEMKFSKGKVTEKMTVVGKTKKSDTGTEITFTPDAGMFETTLFDYKTLRHRLKELAYLNKNITINFVDEREEDEDGNSYKEVYHYEGGISTFVAEVGKRKDNFMNDEVIDLTAEYDTRKITLVDEKGVPNTIVAHDIVEIAFQYNDSYTNNIYSFVNNINTVGGGTHVQGFMAGLTQVVNSFAHEMGYLKEKDNNLSQDDVKEGLVAVVSIKFQEPQFEGQTKGILGSSEARPLVKDATIEFVTRYFEQHPDECKKIIAKNCLAAQAREAARKAKELARSKKAIEKNSLPGKLADCSSKNPEEREIFIVEGDSAGGSAKQGRNRHFQAILPLRGKILNVEKASAQSILKNEELKAMITCFGCGTGEEFDLSKRRYGKIIIMTDADVDGAHIRTLLLTFFYRFMPQLIENGHVFITQPPLFRIKKGKQQWYTYNDEEQKKKLAEVGSEGVTVQRYKGLGEMDPQQLYETTMDPEERTIVQCTVDDAEDADEMFSLLMGDKVPPRRKYIRDNAHKVYNLDF